MGAHNPSPRTISTRTSTHQSSISKYTFPSRHTDLPLYPRVYILPTQPEHMPIRPRPSAYGSVLPTRATAAPAYRSGAHPLLIWPTPGSPAPSRFPSPPLPSLPCPICAPPSRAQNAQQSAEGAWLSPHHCTPAAPHVRIGASRATSSRPSRRTESFCCVMLRRLLLLHHSSSAPGG